MTEPVLRQIGKLSVFDEARATIAKWEAEHPDALQFVIIADYPEGFEYQFTGTTTTSEAAGLFSRCAQLAAE